jgi:hypothetical protein
LEWWVREEEQLYGGSHKRERIAVDIKEKSNFRSGKREGLLRS